MATQYLYGDACPVIVAVLTAEGLEVGDVTGRDTNGDVYPAADETWDTNEATTRQNFVGKFLGVAAQRKVATTAQVYGNSLANRMRVDTAGTFRFDCDSASFKAGDLVGPAKDTGNALLSQKVKSVAAENEAIGRVAEPTSSETTVKVELLSTLMPKARQA